MTQALHILASLTLLLLGIWKVKEGVVGLRTGEIDAYWYSPPIRGPRARGASWFTIVIGTIVAVTSALTLVAGVFGY